MSTLWRYVAEEPTASGTSTEAEIILNGHDHLYERFEPQTYQGVLDLENGIREFIVGTGGVNVFGRWTTGPNPDPDNLVFEANSVSDAHDPTTYGVLQLVLYEGSPATGKGSYSWQFVPEPGFTGTSFQDTGSADCH